MCLPALAGSFLPAAFADLLVVLPVVGISASLTFDADPAKAYNVMCLRDTISRAPFRLLFQAVNGVE
jgi:hypothetical protein